MQRGKGGLVPAHQPRQDEKEEDEDAVVQGKHPQPAAHDEARPPTRPACCIEQDAGDQETRQHKKDIDAYPAAERYLAHCSVEAGGRGQQRHRDRMVENHEEHGGPAQPVERWVVIVRRRRWVTGEL